jgi:hypothetical protein
MESTTSSESGRGQDALRAEAEAALGRGDWTKARALFNAVLETGEDPVALEGLGRAAWWLDDLDSTFEVRERAFQLYRQRGDARAAARVATSLALDYVEYLGEMAVANGWLQRAERLLADEPACPEVGWLRAYQAIFAIESGEAEEGRRLAAEAKALARQLAIFDLEMLGDALEGRILVHEGDVGRGMQLMDQATAAVIAGEVHDLAAAGGACCMLVYTCESIADYERAAQWSARAKAFCRRWGLESFFSVCRAYYANVLMLRGEWSEAERELLAVTGTLLTTRPATGHEALGRLGELRRRQGRIEEAEVLFARTEPNPMGLLGGLVSRSTEEMRRGPLTWSSGFSAIYRNMTGPSVLTPCQCSWQRASFRKMRTPPVMRYERSRRSQNSPTRHSCAPLPPPRGARLPSRAASSRQHPGITRMPSTSTMLRERPSRRPALASRSAPAWRGSSALRLMRASCARPTRRSIL